MHTKICTVDLKSGILCPKCEERVRRGEVTPLDLEVARVLLSLESKYSALQNAYFYRAVEAGDTLVILMGREDVPKVLSYGGKFLKELSERTGKRRIRIVAYNADKRRLLEELFAPASILTINTLWLPDGSTETKVVLSGRDARRLPISISTVKDLARSLMNINLRVEFEESPAYKTARG
jgi:transcription antitermination factor NusA-like protein